MRRAGSATVSTNNFVCGEAKDEQGATIEDQSETSAAGESKLITWKYLGLLDASM